MSGWYQRPMAGSDLETTSQAASFQEHLRRQGKTEVIDGSWPVKARTGAAV